MKIAFITEKLSLTTKEAQSFWPIYNEYSQKIEKLRKTKRSDLGELKINIENSSSLFEITNCLVSFSSFNIIR